MLRLAEYFVVLGYDFEKSKNNQSKGKIIQRFPKNDWPDYKYASEIEMFCQPCGWELSDIKHPPKYFVAYLTDPVGDEYYLACLSFHETISCSLLDHGPSIGNHSRNVSNASGMLNGDFNGTADSDHDNMLKDSNLIKSSEKYAPKTLILLARHSCLDILKNCLSIIYSIHMNQERTISLEFVVANILSAVDVPPIGGSRISFTIGAGDKQIVQPSFCRSLPVTRTCVAMLFKHLGMQNVLVLFSSLISDQKILLYSRSFNRLTEACHSLRSLLYPLKLSNVYIPIIPKDLIDIVSAPTPFVAGVHSTYKPSSDLTDVVMVDLDGGRVNYPDNIPFVPLSEPYNSLTIDSLTKILNPDLLTADEVYPPPPSAPPDPAWQDKQLRAVFIRLFCRLFAGYRSCLTLTRIRPKPVIHFNQALFLLLRGLPDEPDEFVNMLLGCMSFEQLIQYRGIPYRAIDVFDEEYESMTDVLRTKNDSFDDLQIVDKLAKKLYDNECRGTPFTHILPEEATLRNTGHNVQSFQILDEDSVAEYIKKNLRIKTSLNKIDVPEPRFVPHGLELDKHIFKTEALSDKNKVIREFVANIFNNHITEALKRRNTIRQDLKNRLIRRIFIDELYRQLYPDQPDTFSINVDANCERKAVLGYQQFELVNDLMGQALRQEGQNEASGVVPIIMELGTKFCTQLNNVRYYSNMTHQIQEHAVWENQNFWLTAFCDQVNNEIRQLYLHHSESQYRLRTERNPPAKRNSANLVSSVNKSPKPTVNKAVLHDPNTLSQPANSASGDTPINIEFKRILYTNKMSALDMAAEEMKIIDMTDFEVENQEEATVYAQVVHFINLIVNYRIPLNIVDKNVHRTQHSRANNTRQPFYDNDYGDSISMAASASEDSNGDTESGFDNEVYVTAKITGLETWLKKFVDKTASDNNISQKNVEIIKRKIGGIIEGHISTLETIYPEVQNIPKVKKVEVTNPVLLPGERVILINNKESIRCFLLLDGRHEKLNMQRQREQDFEDLGGQTSSQLGNNVNARMMDDDDEFDALRPLLPAQGALFVTNYRVVFHGAPKDPYQSNKVVCRSFPVAGLKSIKKLGLKPFVLNNTSLCQGAGRPNKQRGGDGTLDVIRIRSNTFQMLKIGLELEDSSPELKEDLANKLMFLRYPPIVNLSFNVTDKVDLNHQKLSYCTGLPEDCSINEHDLSLSVSSVYSSMINYSTSIAGQSNQLNLDLKNNIGRITFRLAKDLALNKLSKGKGHALPTLQQSPQRPSQSINKPKNTSESESEVSSVIRSDEKKEHKLSVSDVKWLDKLRITPGYMEYVRLNMTSTSTSHGIEDVKLISNFNDRYQNVKSYPSMFVVPEIFNESSLKKVAKTHRKNRFPIITWQSDKTKAYLLRGACFQAQSIMGKLMKQSAGSQGNDLASDMRIIRAATATLQKPEPEINAAREQLRYFQSIIDISPSYEDIQRHLTSLDPLVPWSDMAGHKVVQLKKNAFGKAYKSMMASGAKAKTSNTEDGIRFSESGHLDDNIDDNAGVSACNLPNQSCELRIVPLYIIGEKSQMKTMSKSENFPSDTEFIGVDFSTKQQIKEAYELLVKAILPDNVSSVPIINNLQQSNATKHQDQQPSFDNTLAVAAKKWLLQLQSLMDLAGSVVDLIDIQAASVAICLEDGWDATSQIVSLAQIMMDPHYRTIAGFWALIEKDWLMSGHKFQSRLLMVNQSKTDNFFPIFLQFLDSVHQLLKQFPLSFEFNDFLLKFLAYHHTSNRFHNFKMDSELERMVWLRAFCNEDYLGSKLYDDNSIWKYIEHHHQEWPVFFNFLYNPRLSQKILRPCTNLSMIDIWEYFLNEDLSSGSVYDLDHFCPSYRKRNTQHYDPILNGAYNNSHVASIYGILGLREGCEVKNWQKIWRESSKDNESDLEKLETLMCEWYENVDVNENSIIKLNSSPRRQSQRNLGIDLLIACIKPNIDVVKLIRQICYVEHKMSSLFKLEKRHLENVQDIVPGNCAPDMNNYLSNTNHQLQRLPTQFEFQTLCNICQNHAHLVGPSMIKCSDCNITCHEKCLIDFPRECVTIANQPIIDSCQVSAGEAYIATPLGLSPVSELSNETIHSNNGKIDNISMDRSAHINPTKMKKEDPGIAASELIFSGDLWKLSQHTLFPSWQKKYFTLDIIRHELRYCDSKESQSNVTRINIQDITGVRILTTLHHHQKRFPESAFLELQTEQRTYRLANELPSAISEWMERIQNSIQ